MKRARKIVQLVSILTFFIIIPVLNKNGIVFISGTLYSFAVGPVWITDPLIGLQTLLTTLSMDRVLLVSVLIPIVFALALGRVFCGWICPQNSLSELADAAAARLGINRLFGPKPSALPRYAVLAAILIAVPLTGLPLASLLSAPGILSAQAARFVYEGTVGLELGLIGLIVLGELALVRRGWCNFLCPVGGFLGLFRWKGTLRVAFAPDADHVCGGCRSCADACRLGLDPMGAALYPLCHNCGDCVAACGAVKLGKKPLMFRRVRGQAE